MKIAGYLLLIAGFIGSAVVSVLEKEVVDWRLFVPLFLIGIAGIVLLRLSSRRHKKCEHRLTNDIQTIEERLGRIVKNITAFREEMKTIDVYEIHRKIDEIFVGDLDDFAEARESIIHAFDMQSYADLMSHFAAGERYLNRVWSASADGYIDEVHAYIDRAAEQFTITQENFRRIKGE